MYLLLRQRSQNAIVHAPNRCITTVDATISEYTMSQQPLSEQDRPSDYPTTVTSRSLLVAVGLVVAMPTALWAIEAPVRMVGLAVVIAIGVGFIRLATRFCQEGHSSFHVPGTEFDIEIAVTRPNRSR